MYVSIILAHPSPQSFNHAIAQTVAEELARNGHHVNFHDLYAEKFDPVLLSGEIPKDATFSKEIEQHCNEITIADGIVIVHPNWWGQPPALLKGWIDRVIRPDVAYRFLEGDQGEGIPVGLLKAKTAVIFNTSNTLAERENNVFGDPLETLWKNCIFGFCNISNVHREMFSVVITSSIEQRQEWLKRVQETIGRLFPKHVST